MTWAYVLRPREMATFRRCRRAWDLGARIRQNFVPAQPHRVFDFDKAIHDALAVYYFPAMDDWDRAIVRPLALKGFLRSLEEDRARYEKTAPLTPEQEEEWEEALQRGEAMLTGYFAWAAPLDTFASIFSDQEYWAPIPDPANPGSDLVNAAGREIRYLGRVDQLFSDVNDQYWIAMMMSSAMERHLLERITDGRRGAVFPVEHNTGTIRQRQWCDDRAADGSGM